MAWNEPGNNKDQDPWNKNNDGPPDLDQVFKKIMDNLNKIFGGGGSSGSSSGIGLGIIIFGFTVLYLLSGLFTVKPYEMGVITRFGKYHRTVSEGLHWHPKFVDYVKKINTENIKSSRHSGWMLTEDENILLVEIEVQYRVIDPEKYMFNVSSPDGALRQATDSAMRQVIGDSLTDDVLTDKKQSIAEAIKTKLKATLDTYDAGFRITAVNFKDSRPPDEVKAAFDDVTKSREDKERLQLQADAYANKIIPEAQGQANKMILEAEAYKERVVFEAEGQVQKFKKILPEYLLAPEIMRTRMYIAAKQEVLNNTTKVLLDTGKGNNLVYLPIDKIIGKNNKSEGNK